MRQAYRCVSGAGDGTDASLKYTNFSSFRRIFSKATPFLSKNATFHEKVNSDTMVVMANSIVDRNSTPNKYEKVTRKRKKKKRRKRRRTVMQPYNVCNPTALVCCTCQQYISASHPIMQRPFGSVPVTNLNICLTNENCIPTKQSQTLKSVVRWVLRCLRGQCGALLYVVTFVLCATVFVH